MTTEDSYKKIWDKNQMLISIAKATDDKEHRDLLAMYNKINAFLSYGARMVFNDNQERAFKSQMWTAMAQKTLNYNPNIMLDKLRKFVNNKLPSNMGIWDMVIIITSYFRSVDEMTSFAEGFIDSLDAIGGTGDVPEVIPFAVYLSNKRRDEAVEELKETDTKPSEVSMSDVEDVESFMNFDNLFGANAIDQYYQKKE